MNQSIQAETCLFIKNAVQQTHPVFISNIITCVLDFFVSITASMSNALIVHVIWKNKALHSASNTLIGCLAVTDLLVGSLVAPFNILTKFGEMVNNEDIYCVAGVISSLIGWTSGGLSFLTLALISVERYLAIRLHLRYAAMVPTKRILKVMASFCCFFVFVIASLRFWETKEVLIRPILVATTALCVGLTVFCYGEILASVRRHRKHIINHVSVATNTGKSNVCISDRVPNSQTSAAKVTMARQKKYTLTMVYVLIFFFLCYLPSFVYQILAATLRNRADDRLMRIAYRFTFSLAMLNSALNPALYCLRIADLREAVINFVKKATQRSL